jgi:predicted nucleic acid-binding protein
MKKGDESVLRQFDEFFAARDVEKIPLGAAEFDLATRIRAAHGTKTPDALHLAAAMLGECEEFWTNDSRLKAAARGRLQIRIFS